MPSVPCSVMVLASTTVIANSLSLIWLVPAHGGIIAIMPVLKAAPRHRQGYQAFLGSDDLFPDTQVMPGETSHILLLRSATLNPGRCGWSWRNWSPSRFCTN